MPSVRRIERAIERAFERLRGHQERRHDRRPQVERELAAVKASERCLVDAIAHGQAVEPLPARLRLEEDRKRALGAELATLQVRRAVPSRVSRLAELREAAAGTQEALVKNGSGARRLLRTLVRRRLDCHPVVIDGRRGYGSSAQAPTRLWCRPDSHPSWW